MGINIAIDGPAGAGKSTIAKLLAAKLGFIYVDTGAMYRAMALYMLNNGIDKDDEAKVTGVLDQVSVTIRHEDGAQQVYLNDRNVSGMIRTEEVGNTASKISSYGAVRAALLDLQRGLAAANDVIMDGRDIGTTILPNAELKIFLTASVEVRAKRRYDELMAKGETCDLERIAEDIAKRDEQDRNREVSPLKKAEDAIEVDTSDMTIEQVVDRLNELYEGVKRQA